MDSPTSDGDTEADERLKNLQKANHFCVGKISEDVGRENGVVFQRQVTATIAEVAFEQLRRFGVDLEAFAKHAKRTKINTDDVKLLVRNNAPLAELVGSMIEEKPEPKKREKKGAAASKAT